MAETRCPTCNADDPANRRRWLDFSRRGLGKPVSCADPFHDEAKAEAGAQSPNPQSVAAQPEGAERRWLLEVCRECGLRLADIPESERFFEIDRGIVHRGCGDVREIGVVPEALLHKERARLSAIREGKPYPDCWGDCGEGGTYCCDGLWDAKRRAEQRIESLERAIKQHRDADPGECEEQAEYDEWLKRRDAALYGALDTTQADQRQAAFLARHEERMQAVDEALDRQEVDGG